MDRRRKGKRRGPREAPASTESTDQRGSVAPVVFAEGPLFANHRVARALLGLMLLGFATWFGRSLDAYGMFMWDEAEYATIGRSVLRGEGFSIAGRPNQLRPPVLPLAGAASLALAGDESDRIVKRPMVVFAVLAMWAVYMAVAARQGRRAALAAAACLGTFPAFAQAVPQFLSEIPFMAFFFAAVASLYFGLYHDARYFVASAVAASLALLTRYTAMLFAPIALAFVVVALVGRAPGVRGRLLSRPALVSLVVGAALLLPWFLRQHLTFGDALIGVKESSTQLQVYMPGVSMPSLFYAESLPAMVSWPLLLAAVAGLVWALVRRHGFALHCAAVALGLFAWFSVYRYKETRMVLPALPFIAALAGMGLHHWIAGMSALRRLVTPALAGVLLVVFWVNAGRTKQVLERSVTLGYPSFLDAMRALRARTSKDALVMGPNIPQIAWYGDRRAIDFPGEEGRLRESLARVEWAVVTNFERGQRPYVLPMLQRMAPALSSKDGEMFKAGQFGTMLVRASAWRAWLRSRPAGAGSGPPGP